MKIDKKYKDPINLLILLAFISQGFFWENIYVPILFSGVWLICLYFRKEKQFINRNIELFIFFISLIFCLKFIGQNSYYKMFGMGNALFVLQAMRLMWPLDKRKRTLSIMISVTMLAVGSQFIVNYSFILVLTAAIILLPKSLFVLESQGYKGVPAPRSFGKGRIFYPAVTFIMILFFIIFPRNKFISGKETGMILREGPMKPKMDTVSGGTNLSAKAILRIEGEEIEYLKGFSLDTFDGNNWTASQISYRLESAFDVDELEQYDHRKVKVMDLTYIGSSLPVDGHVMYLRGNFFQGAIGMSGQENVLISLKWPQTNNTYEYWTSKKKFRTLEDVELTRYTSYPEHSDRLQNWMEGIVGTEKKDSSMKADIITSHIRNNFTYNTGVPDLERSAPVEDFIFNQKEGHCERYASALALLFRMMKIPSRVVVGYHVPPRNQFAEYHSVQAQHAHAWVEAYIKDKGWVIYDATPAGGTGAAEAAPGLMLTVQDWIEYIWYSKVVEFSANDQSSILSGTQYSAQVILGILKEKIGWVIPVFMLVVMGIIAYNFRHWIRLFAFSKKKRVEKQLEAAERFYADLLKSLAKVKIYRQAHQTPLELLELIKNQQISYFDDIELVTQNFCLVKYAEQDLNPIQLKATADAVSKIKHSTRKRK